MGNNLKTCLTIKILIGCLVSDFICVMLYAFGAYDDIIMEKGFTDYISKPVKYEVLELVLKEYIPREKQLAPSGADELPVVLLWGNDTSALKAEKERLDGIYRCVCASGEKGRDKYLEKHNPDAVMFVKERANITEMDDV